MHPKLAEKKKNFGHLFFGPKLGRFWSKMAFFDQNSKKKVKKFQISQKFHFFGFGGQKLEFCLPNPPKCPQILIFCHFRPLWDLLRYVTATKESFLIRLHAQTPSPAQDVHFMSRTTAVLPKLSPELPPELGSFSHGGGADVPFALPCFYLRMSADQTLSKHLL